MHTIEKKKESSSHNSGYPIPAQGTHEIAFQRVQFYQFPGGGIPPDPPRSSCLLHSTFAPAARTVHVRQLNNCIRYFQMLPKTLRRTSANCWTKKSIYLDPCLKPPYNGHFLLSPRWPLQRGSTVYKWNSKKRYVICLFAVPKATKGKIRANKE